MLLFPAMERLSPLFITSIYGKSDLMKYMLGRRGQLCVLLFVFTSTKKNEFYDNLVDSKFVMHHSE